MNAWQPCPSYNAGDIVTYDGHIWEAKTQSAGKEPSNPNNGAYWKDLGTFTPLGDIRHDDTSEKHGTSATEFNHVSDDEADAILNSYQPSASNPFLTASQMEALKIHLGEFERLSDAPLAMIYGAAGNDGSLIVVGDNRIAWTDGESVPSWNSQDVTGLWRAAARFGASSFVVVGKDAAAFGIPGSMTSALMPAGNWKGVAAGNSKAVAVADGRTSVTSNGSSWTAHDTPVGFGDDIAFNESDGLFYAVGRLGCKTSPDGVDWTDSGLPPATWRCVTRGFDRMIALSGKAAFKEDGGEWVIENMPLGGWEDAASGGGFTVAVGNDIVASAGERAATFVMNDAPDYVYTTVEYFAGRFWILGSAVVAARVTNVGEALDAANDPNADNPYATMADIAEIAAALTSL